MTGPWVSAARPCRAGSGRRWRSPGRSSAIRRSCVLDEPTSAMDNAGETGLKTCLTAELSGRTLLLVTHRASLLSLVDRLIVLDGGKLVADGPKDQVLKALAAGQIAGRCDGVSQSSEWASEWGNQRSCGSAAQGRQGSRAGRVHALGRGRRSSPAARPQPYPADRGLCVLRRLRHLGQHGDPRRGYPWRGPGDPVAADPDRAESRRRHRGRDPGPRGRDRRREPGRDAHRQHPGRQRLPREAGPLSGAARRLRTPRGGGR